MSAIKMQVILEDGVMIFGQTKGGFWTQHRVIAPWMIASVMTPGNARGPKPISEAFARAPEWEVQLRFAADLLIRILERAPGIGSVETLRIVNPQYGPVFDDDDTREMSGDLRSACARALAGNNVDGGTLVVNREHRFGFNADCRGQVDVHVMLEGVEAWLLPTLRQDVEACARAAGITATSPGIE